MAGLYPNARLVRGSTGTRTTCGFAETVTCCKL